MAEIDLKLYSFSKNDSLKVCYYSKNASITLTLADLESMIRFTFIVSYSSRESFYLKLRR